MPAYAPPARRSAPRTARPREDPRYQAALRQADAGAARLKRHAPAAQKAREASRSARAPANERQAGAQARVVDRVREAPTPPPRPASFKALLRAEIERAMPRTLGQTEAFMNPGQAGAMKQSLQGNVAQQKAGATGALDQANRQSPNAGAVPPVPSTPLPAEPTPAPAAVDGAAAMPAPAAEAEVSLQDSKQETAQRMAAEDVQPQQLQRANDARFSAVLTAQSQVAAQADRAPGQYRAREGAVLSGARAQAAGAAQRGGQLLALTRGRGNTQVLTRQQQQAAREEAERQRVAAHIQGIYARTQARVQQRLASLDGEVAALFDTGVDAALQAMKRFVDTRLRAYKFDRYLSIPVVGAARWVRDQFLGLPEEVDAFYAEGRRVFQGQMDRLIDRVAALVEARLAQAKADVAAGQAEIRTYVGALPGHLRAAGQAAERAVGERFAELTRSIDDKKNELASSLAQRYKDAFEKADQALQSIRDENRGLVQGFVEKLAAVVQAIREFKARLMAAMRRGEETIALIMRDPGAFLGRLLDALKGGFNRFVDNIWTHLKNGFLQWMFGSLAAVGVTLPPDFSIGSILRLVLQVLGLTYDRIRARAVRLIGERAVTVIEKVGAYLHDLFTGGPAKLWEHLKQDLADLKAMVVDAIQDWLITTLIKQAVLKIVSMFNPVGAIIQVILTIVNVVMFVVEQAQRILALVESVLQSVHAIATGAIGGAITWIERALANTIPIVIGFLARLLGLSGLTQKIQEFIRRIQARVEAAIDKVLAKVVGMFRAAGSAVAGAAKKLIAWWKREHRFSADGESHRVFFTGDARRPQLRVASTEKSLLQFLADVRTRASAKPKNQAQLTLADKVEAAQTTIEDLRKKRNPPKPEDPDPVDKEIDDQFTFIANNLPKLFGGDKWGTPERPVLLLKYPKKALSLYRTLYLGPRVNGKLRQSALQAELATKPGKKASGDNLNEPIPGTPKALKAWIARGGQVRAYQPFSPQSWPDGESHSGSATLGVQLQFQTQPGTNFLLEAGTTPGGRKLNEALKRFGYFGKKDGGENSDGDHILEAQIIGRDRADRIANMWPLDKTENRHGEKLMGARAKVDLAAGVNTIEEAVASKDKKKEPKLWVMIQSTD